MSWISEHWSAGLVGGLVVVDAIVLLVCFVDLLRFWSTGLSAEVAWSLLQEKPRLETLVDGLDGAFTFAILFLLLPAANAALIAVFRHLASKDKSLEDKPSSDQTEVAPAPGKPYLVAPSTVKIRSLVYRRVARLMVRPGKRIWILHLCSAALIASFTVWMRSAVILEGNAYTPDALPHPAFFSAWMAVVSTWKVMTPAVFLPVLRKYFVRMFGGEHPHIFHVFSEVFSEDLGMEK